MKTITNTKEAGTLLSKGGFRWFPAGSHTTRLTRRSDGLFEFRLHRGHDITQTQETIAHQLIEAAASQNAILGIASATYEKVSDREGDSIIVIQFTLELKEYGDRVRHVRQQLPEIVNISPDQLTEDPANPRSGRVFTEFEFLSHLAELTGLYIEGAKDDDPEWLAHLGRLEGGAVDFAQFIIALDGETKEPSTNQLLEDGRQHPLSEEDRNRLKSKTIATLQKVDSSIQSSIETIRGMQTCRCGVGPRHARRDCPTIEGGK
jgi:hypothetical protein